MKTRVSILGKHTTCYMYKKNIPLEESNACITADEKFGHRFKQLCFQIHKMLLRRASHTVCRTSSSNGAGCVARGTPYLQGT